MSNTSGGLLAYGWLDESLFSWIVTPCVLGREAAQRVAA
jgi:hypothetical protein